MGFAYKFTCIGGYFFCISEKRRCLSTKVKASCVTDKQLHTLKQLKEKPICKVLCNENSFKVTNCVTSPFRLKVKETSNIDWVWPELNKSNERVRIIISV